MTNVQLTDNNPTSTTPPRPPHAVVGSDTLGSWLSHPSESFERWTATHPLKESTKKVKGAMWNKFARWMGKSGIRLDWCTPHHLSSFFKDERITKAQRQRYIRLIEQIYTHLIALGLDLDNPGQEAGYARLGAGSNDDKRFFTSSERLMILEGMERVRGDVEERKKREKGKDQWPVLRDMAMIGVMWGGGLRVSEVCHFPVNCTSEEWIDVPSFGDVPAHRAHLLPVGVEALRLWLPVRLSLSVESDLLFPPDASRRRHGYHPPAAMHPASVFRRVAGHLKAFGVEGHRVSPQTLRNTYGAMLIEAGADDGTIMANMGLAADFTVPRMRESHKNMIGGVA